MISSVSLGSEKIVSFGSEKVHVVGYPVRRNKKENLGLELKTDFNFLSVAQWSPRKNIEQLIVAGRHYSATPEAQRLSREIPPCMAQGEAAGIAAVLALDGNILIRKVDPKAIQRKMREQGADPGDNPSSNALNNKLDEVV